MFWYNTPSDSAPEDVIALKKATGVRREEVAGRNHTFVVTMKNPVQSFLSSKILVYPFSSDDSEQMEAWLRVVGKAIVRYVCNMRMYVYVLDVGADILSKWFRGSA